MTLSAGPSTYELPPLGFPDPISSKERARRYMLETKEGDENKIDTQVFKVFLERGYITPQKGEYLVVQGTFDKVYYRLKKQPNGENTYERLNVDPETVAECDKLWNRLKTYAEYAYGHEPESGKKQLELWNVNAEHIGAASSNEGSSLYEKLEEYNNRTLSAREGGESVYLAIPRSNYEGGRRFLELGQEFYGSNMVADPDQIVTYITDSRGSITLDRRLSDLGGPIRPFVHNHAINNLAHEHGMVSLNTAEGRAQANNKMWLLGDETHREYVVSEGQNFVPSELLAKGTLNYELKAMYKALTRGNNEAPVVVKGEGASGESTFKISNFDQLERFFTQQAKNEKEVAKFKKLADEIKYTKPGQQLRMEVWQEKITHRPGVVLNLTPISLKQGEEEIETGVMRVVSASNMEQEGGTVYLGSVGNLRCQNEEVMKQVSLAGKRVMSKEGGQYSSVVAIDILVTKDGVIVCECNSRPSGQTLAALYAYLNGVLDTRMTRDQIKNAVWAIFNAKSKKDMRAVFELARAKSKEFEEQFGGKLLARVVTAMPIANTYQIALAGENNQNDPFGIAKRFQSELVTQLAK